MAKNVVFEVPRTGVLTIQGGGALAAELIGQLKGVTGAKTTLRGPTGDHEMDVVGLAGASAGSIIATLFWAGYDPDEILRHLQDIFSPAGREHFFGPYDPSLLHSYAAFERFLARLTAAFSPGWEPSSRRRLLPGLRLLWVKAVLLLTLAQRVPRFFARNGMFDADGFVQTIDRLLRESPKLRNRLAALPRAADGTERTLLTFGDLRGRPELGLVPLFLMVSDVGGQRLKMVSSIDDGLLDMPIARAVRASADFPYFFRPAKLPGAECCIDGGVISNLPTWVFDGEFRQRLRQAETGNPVEDELLHRIARLPWHHVALRLPPDDPAPAGDGILPATSEQLRIFAAWNMAGHVDEAIQIEDGGAVTSLCFICCPMPPGPPGRSIAEPGGARGVCRRTGGRRAGRFAHQRHLA